MSFYQRDTITVARELLGKRLVRKLNNGTRLSGFIVETEAYLGANDPACHSFDYKKTARTETMYLPGGYSYVYFIYGMYNCFNVVSENLGEPEAILIRALQPDEGVEQMQCFREQKLNNLTNGPGKLCQALNITRELNSIPLLSEDIFIETAKEEFADGQIVDCERIGVDYAGDAAHWPLRFYLNGNPFVSRK